MLSKKALVVYIGVVGCAAYSVVSLWRAIQVPWLGNGHGQYIGSRRFYTYGDSIEFPDQQICYGNPSFCASWRTATFLLTLALIPESLTLLALLFSWAFHHRRKTVLTAKYLLGTSSSLLVIGLLFWRHAYKHITEVSATEGWKLIGGWNSISRSMAYELLSFVLMFNFRDLVRDRTRSTEGDGQNDGSNSVINTRYYDDSDDSMEFNENDDDDISVPDDIPEEQIDFYIFNKRARRQELERRS